MQNMQKSETYSFHWRCCFYLKAHVDMQIYKATNLRQSRGRLKEMDYVGVKRAADPRTYAAVVFFFSTMCLFSMRFFALASLSWIRRVSSS
jgi:hypothetical protein